MGIQNIYFVYFLAMSSLSYKWKTDKNGSLYSKLQAA